MGAEETRDLTMTEGASPPYPISALKGKGKGKGRGKQLSSGTGEESKKPVKRFRPGQLALREVKRL